MGIRRRLTARKERLRRRSSEEVKNPPKKRRKEVVAAMASFDIFLHLAILCFFTLSQVRAKHFLVETKDSSEEKFETLDRNGKWPPKTTTWPDPTTTTITTAWTTPHQQHGNNIQQMEITQKEY